MTNKDLFDTLAGHFKPMIISSTAINRMAGRRLASSGYLTGLTVPYRDMSGRSFILIEATNYFRDINNAADVMIHEAAHSIRTKAWLESLANGTDDRIVEELYADMTAMFVKEHFGLDFSDNQYHGHFVHVLREATSKQIGEARRLAKWAAAIMIGIVNEKKQAA